MKISGGVQDVQVNGLSIVSDNSANLVLGPGLTYDDNGLQMVLTNLPSVVPKDLDLEQQNNITILTDNNGTLSKASVNSLDYTKLKVVNQEDLSIINTDDFLFVKEGNK